MPSEEERHTTEGWKQALEGRIRRTGDTSDEYPGVSLSILPPLLLEILLPPSYPTYDPPQIVALHATHGWLGPKIVPLRQLLLNMWQAGDSVLYSWIEWLRSGEFLESLHLLDSVGGKDVVR